MTIELVWDGDSVIALIGRDLQTGIAGVGDSASEALRDLANAIERKKWQLPGKEKPRGPVRVR
jgi:hypothetical protein